MDGTLSCDFYNKNYCLHEILVDPNKSMYNWLNDNIQNCFLPLKEHNGVFKRQPSSKRYASLLKIGGWQLWRLASQIYPWNNYGLGRISIIIAFLICFTPWMIKWLKSRRWVKVGKLFTFPKNFHFSFLLKVQFAQRSLALWIALDKHLISWEAF